MSTDDWSWEICLSLPYMHDTDGEKAYVSNSFSYYGALNLSLITSQFLPHLKLFKYDEDTSVLVLFLDKNLPSSVLEKLRPAVSSNSDNPYVILNDVLTQDTSAFAIRRLCDGVFCHERFEGLSNYTGVLDYDSMLSDMEDVEVTADNTVVLAYHVSEVISSDSGSIMDDAELSVFDCALPVRVVESELYMDLDTHSLALSLSSLSDLPEDERTNTYFHIMAEIQRYIDEDEPTTSAKNTRQGDKAKSKNRKKSKLARKAKAKQRRK